MKSISVLVIILLIYSAYGSDEKNSGWFRPKSAVVDMKNGDRFIGQIKLENDSVIIINADKIGELSLERRLVSKKYLKDLNDGSNFIQTDPNINSFLIAPTAECNMAGSIYISSYELMYLNAGMALTNDLHLAVSGFFPVSKTVFEQTPKSIGTKYRFHDTPSLDLAAMATLSTDVYNNSLTYGMAMTYRTGNYDRCVINLYLGGIHTRYNSYFSSGDDSDKRTEIANQFNYSAGISFQTGTNLKFMLEHFKLNKSENIDYLSDEIFNELTLFGIRFFGENVSCDVAAIFGFEDMLLPWVNLNYYLR